MLGTAGNTTSSENGEQINEDDIAYRETIMKGKEDGLFRTCMKAIRNQHNIANQIRAGLVVAGLFSDRNVYKEAIVSFYVVTKRAESKLYSSSFLRDSISEKLRKLGYRFSDLYREDMKSIFGEDWEHCVDQISSRNCACGEYLQLLDDCESGEDLAGAIFALWGALVIGGGAAALPRVKRLMGEGATHLFQSVAGIGRNSRRRGFIEAWDNLAEPGTPEFTGVLRACTKYMNANNKLLANVPVSPYWWRYSQTILQATIVACFGVGLYYLVQIRNK